MRKIDLFLLRSLCGSHTEFSFKNKVANVTTIEKNIEESRKRISKDSDLALSVGGKLAVMLLAELTAFYREEPYYMAVRGAIRMRRYRLRVLDYLRLSVDERATRLMGVLSEKISGDKNRDLKISALRYFLSIYTSRIKDFKHLLTREEYLIVS